MKQANLRYDWLREKHGIHLRLKSTSTAPPQLLKLYSDVENVHRIKLPEYRKAVDKWPENPMAKQLLILALYQLGKVTEGEKLIRTSIQEHPDDIFLIHTCIKLCDTKKQALQYRSLLGEHLSIKDFPPGKDDSYTLNQFKTHELAVINYHILVHEFDSARERLNRLLAFGLTEQELDEEITELMEASQFYFNERIAKAEARRIVVPGRRRVVLKGLGKPQLQHPELECLYEMLPEEMSETRLEALLKLPRASLIADLRAILRDGLERYDEFTQSNLPEKELFFPIHAIRLLGILRAVETLPEVLDYLRMEEGFIDFWFGDFADRFILPAIYFLSAPQLPILFEYLKESDTHYYNRVQVTELPAQVLIHQPERREEVVSLYKDLLEFLLNTEQEGVVDSDFITDLAVPVTMTQSAELLPPVRELYRRGLIDDSVQGNLKAIERAFVEGATEYEVMALPETPYEFYSLAYRERKQQALITAGLMKEFEPTAIDKIINRRIEEKLAKRKVVKKVKKVKVGRNDPCPCGSGKKYKKCCL